MQTTKSAHNGKYGGSDDLKSSALFARQSHADGRDAISNLASRVCVQTPQSGLELPTGNVLANWRIGADVSQSELAGLMRQWSGDSYPSLRTVQMIEQSRQAVTAYYWLLFQMVFGMVSVAATGVKSDYQTPLTLCAPVVPCADCGSVHHTRCNGNSGPVVVLADNERVVGDKPRRTPGRKRLRREMTPEQAAAWDGLTREERDKVMGI